MGPRLSRAMSLPHTSLGTLNETINPVIIPGNSQLPRPESLF